MSTSVDVKSRVLTALVCFYAVLFYYFMEGLFIITKPSCLTAVPLQKAFLILGAAFLPYIIGVSLFIVIGESAIFCFPRCGGLVLKFREYLAAAVLGITFFIMLDNFLYTLFSIGPLTGRGFLRGIYATVFIALCFFSYRLVKGFMAESVFQQGVRRLITFGVFLSLISLGAIGYRMYDLAEDAVTVPPYNLGVPRSRPNIIILSLARLRIRSKD